MKLASYDRLFPSQDLLPSGGVGNLIAAPLFRLARDEGRTVFVDPGTLEPHHDQWAYLSAMGRTSPRGAARAADQASRVLVGSEVTRLAAARSSATRPAAAPVIHGRLGAGIRLEQSELTPGVAATLRRAASMYNPALYERQRMRASTWNVPRFLHSFDETIDGGLTLPPAKLRGSIDVVTLQTLARRADVGELTAGYGLSSRTNAITCRPRHSRTLSGRYPRAAGFGLTATRTGATSPATSSPGRSARRATRSVLPQSPPWRWQDTASPVTRPARHHAARHPACARAGPSRSPDRSRHRRVPKDDQASTPDRRMPHPRQDEGRELTILASDVAHHSEV
jgi:hypothetical protein